MSNVIEEHVEVPRGRDTIIPPSGGKKTRGSSKPRGEDITPLEEKLSLLENALSTIDVRVQKVEHDKETLESHVLGQLDLLKEDVLSTQKGEEEREEHLDTLESKLEIVMKQLEELKTSLEEVKARPTGIASSSGVRDTPRIDLPKPKEFKGVRDAREVENFLWQMERYFECMKVEDEQMKVRTVSLYLTDNATLWWRRKHADMEKGLYTIATWDDFKKELKKQFFPENVVYEARKKLRELKHKTTISDYVREFTTLTLQIPNLATEDAFFFFIDGLKSWAKQEL